MKPHYVLVNGIRTNPNDVNGWTDHAEEWLEDYGYSATKYEYFCTSVFRWVRQPSRSRSVAEIIKRSVKPVVYVGHSNGCEILAKIFREDKMVRIKDAHLFAPAVDPDFDANGFNKAFRDGRIERLFIYGSKADHTLRIGNKLTGWLRFIGMGYGHLGYEGPRNQSGAAILRTYVHWQNEFAHSDWFKPHNFEKSMNLTVRK